MEGDRENYHNYIYRPNSFEPLALTRHHSFEYDYYQEHRHTDRTLPVRQKPEICWYQNDHLGTPHCLTDAHGQAVWKSSYLAFGSIKTEANNGAGIDNPLRFAGQYHDRETGLFYNLNRYYDPAMKRYLTQDPVGLAGGLNPYLYVEGNPIKKIDPLGLSSLGNDPTGDRSPEPEIQKKDNSPLIPKTKQEEQIDILRNGGEIRVSSVDEARNILDNMPELKPSGSGGYIPGDIDPPGTYRGDLINKQDPESSKIHPRGPHMHTPHYNLTLRTFTENGGTRRKKAAIFVDGK